MVSTSPGGSGPAGGTGPGHLPPPLPRAEQEYWAARLPDPEAVDRLVTHNLRLVWQQVSRMRGVAHMADDLFSVGCEALLYAARHFDPACGVRFSTYAVPAIRNRILHRIRAEYAGKRHPAEPLAGESAMANMSDGRDTADEALSRVMLERFMASISERDRRILCGIAQGYSHQEVADLIGCTRMTVHRRIKALQRQGPIVSW